MKIVLFILLITICCSCVDIDYFLMNDPKISLENKYHRIYKKQRKNLSKETIKYINKLNSDYPIFHVYFTNEYIRGMVSFQHKILLMRHKHTFPDEASYYSVYLHELAHTTFYPLKRSETEFGISMIEFSGLKDENGFNFQPNEIGRKEEIIVELFSLAMFFYLGEEEIDFQIENLMDNYFTSDYLLSDKNIDMYIKEVKKIFEYFNADKFDKEDDLRSFINAASMMKL